MVSRYDQVSLAHVLTLAGWQKRVTPPPPLTSFESDELSTLKSANVTAYLKVSAIGIYSKQKLT